MKKCLFISALFLAVFTIGCTASTQKLSAIAMDRGIDHQTNIVYDLSTLAKQQALDLGVQEVRSAVAAQDEAAAQKALEKSFNTLNRIAWLEVENEKAKSYMRLAQMYISSQQGVLDLLYKDFNRAKAVSDAEDPSQ